MKRFYAMMGVTVAMVFSASATDFSNRASGLNTAGWTLQSAKELKVEMPTTEGSLKVDSRNLTRAGVPGGLGGVYYIEWYDVDREEYVSGGFEIIVNSDGKTGLLATINSVGNLKVNIDEAAGTISILNQATGDKQSWTGKDPDGNTITDNIAPVFQHYVINDDRRLEISDEPLVFEYLQDGIFKPKNGANDVFRELAPLENHPDLVLTYNIPTFGYNITLYKYPEKLDNTGWENIGEATFIDNYITDGAELTCPVQRSKTEAGVYRLVNPYNDLFTNVKYIAEGELRFDVSCPTAPMIMFGPTIYNGILIPEVAPEYGWPENSPLQYFLSFTTYASSFYYGQDFEGDEVFTKEELGEEFGEDECGSVKGNVITFAGLQNSISLNMGLYNWDDDADLYSQKFIVTMPEGWMSGVNDVYSDDTNAPVKYFNLQGMEVANPEAGQLVIKKQGSKATKLIAK